MIAMTSMYRRSLFYVALVLFGGCYAEENAPHKASVYSAVRVNQADDAWKKNERAIRRALSGRLYSVKEFEDGCRFFKNVTGIEIRGDGSFFGWLPNEYTGGDFKKVEAWYSAHRGRLYWDEASKSVAVRAVPSARMVCAEGDRSHRRALEEWERNEKIINLAVRQGRFAPSEFLKSVVFFEEIAGLEIRGDSTSTLGLAPGKYSVEDFGRVQEWCTRRCRYLCWDNSSRSITIGQN